MSFILRGIGDLLLSLDGPDWSDPGFQALQAWLQEADLTFANLEAPLVDSGLPIMKPDLARADTSATDTLKRLGIDVVSVANNHVMDFGPRGLKSTLQALDAAGIARCGAGMDEASAFAPVYLQAGGSKIAFLAFHLWYFPYGEHYTDALQADGDTPGAAIVRGFQVRIPGDVLVAPEERFLKRLLDSVAGARAQADHVVVSMHTHLGFECAEHVDPARQLVARAVVDAGAALVLGHGPHATNGIERYREAWIVHSMGNFYFYQMPEIAARYFHPDSRLFSGNYRKMDRYWNAFSLEARFDGGPPSELVAWPISIVREGDWVGMPRPADETWISWMAERLAHDSRGMGVEVKREGDRLRITPS